MLYIKRQNIVGYCWSVPLDYVVPGNAARLWDRWGKPVERQVIGSLEIATQEQTN